MTSRIILLAPLALAACTSAPAQDMREGYPARQPVGDCVDREAQGHLGHRASSETGQQLLVITGARELRWVPPNTAVTMDFRADRLTVHYDENMRITRISCG